ncbi:MAG TPA: hypothetical protein VNX68_19655 [Nitrosopumilaceae archaeon]|jgi:hypothetical protein|nr:hypothetical protein [Nitrosopumilaceae archaeon]
MHDKNCQIPTKLKTVWRCGCDLTFTEYSQYSAHKTRIIFQFGSKQANSQHSLVTEQTPVQD